MTHTTSLVDIHTKCLDGFCNQLRMLLAGIYLVRENYIERYTQEWTLSNHNNVDFLDFFVPIHSIRIKNVSQKNVTYTEGTFKGLTDKYVEHNDIKWNTNLLTAFKSLKLKDSVQQRVDCYIKKIKCQNLVGVHVRRTCKLSANKVFNRKGHLLDNKELLYLLEDYKQNIYVATDNKETQRFFKTNLGKQFVAYKSISNGTENFNYDTYYRDKVIRHTSALHTIIDFYVLLNCKRFIGTENSSFTSLIYHLRDNKNDYKINSCV